MTTALSDYQPGPDLLQDRIILVTGAGSGIGAELAATLAAHGATVILLGRTIKTLEQVYDRIVDAGHPAPAIVPLDLEGATPEHYQQLAETLEQEFGRLDGLVHNAAQLGALTPVEHYDTTLWARVLQVNLNAPFLLTRALLPLLKKSSAASLIFTSASEIQGGRAYWGAYSVSKAGADNLMQILASELETNTPIRVNSLIPGPVQSQTRRTAFPGEDPNQHALIERILPAYLYLLGPDSENVNGQILQAQQDTLS
ncbi:YciK family oxidoreductase [Thiohalophilus sp.]|uniref:YciK family oxidoreductase n=1 Tax=Thiohalophilus sp. TaxID=3028392 RepID=UPI002ACE5A0D|nr:YciK family oxidoreductase [Thiohalophilus sp.]MDZ7662748.1 YciK family oxidoreductase [Thiohalophilus sp.]